MNSESKQKNIPTVFIIFGATGNLANKKILPALFHLHKKGKLPTLLKVIAFSRRDLTQDQYKEFIKESLDRHGVKNDKTLFSFYDLFIYQKGDFQTIDSYKVLAQSLGHIDGEWKTCANKLFYLAVPPKFYKTMFEYLSESDLTIPCGPDEGWTRILVEKPFGDDFETAHELDQLLGKLFKEEQIYRIDHYLGKEMVQNILSFRFSNNLFKKTWDKESIESIEVRILEKIGVETRGSFYDGVGALRDVGQNHLLQMLSLVTMDQPQSFTSDKVRPKRAFILEKLHAMTPNEVKQNTSRGQYEGYRDIKDVPSDSKTETYFKLNAAIDSEKWRGVPITIEGGKKMKNKKEIIITFAHPTPCLCPDGIKDHYKNKIIFSLDPKDEIEIQFWAKKPGLEFELERQTFKFSYRKKGENDQYAEEYEKLLLDSILGNQLLFVGTDELQAMWKFIDPIKRGWNKNDVPLQVYDQGAVPSAKLKT